MFDEQDGCGTVGGRMFLLVPAYLGSAGQRAVKQLCLCFSFSYHICYWLSLCEISMSWTHCLIL